MSEQVTRLTHLKETATRTKGVIAELAATTADAISELQDSVDILLSENPPTYTIDVLPSQYGTLVYNGNEQSPEWNGYSYVKLTLGGVTSATDAGTYTATFTPKNNYVWADETNTTKTVDWAIECAQISTTPSPVNATLLYDGTEQSPEWNDYDSEQLEIGGVTSATEAGTYTATFTPTANYQWSNGTKTARSVEWVISPTIYGVEWDGSSTTLWSRTDASANFVNPVPAVSASDVGSSPFDDIYPWSGMVKVEDETLGTLVSIPKFYYKLTQNGAAVKIQISDTAQDGFSVSPAHMDRGDGAGERDMVYIGRYHCGATAYKSTSGETPMVSITRSDARTAIHNLGTDVWQCDFAMRFTVWLLYLVEFANWDTQSTIGGGCSQTTATSSAAFANGTTDSMVYHTGNVQGSHSAYGACQYRWIEGLWDNVYDWMDGCYYSTSGMSVILKQSAFSDTANGVVIGTPTSGYPSAFTVVDVSGAFPAFIPSESSGSSTTCSCDYWNFNSSYPCLYVGGYYSRGADRGLSYVNRNTASYANAYIGCRLQKTP